MRYERREQTRIVGNTLFHDCSEGLAGTKKHSSRDDGGRLEKHDGGWRRCLGVDVGWTGCLQLGEVTLLFYTFQSPNTELIRSLF